MLLVFASIDQELIVGFVLVIGSTLRAFPKLQFATAIGCEVFDNNQVIGSRWQAGVVIGMAIFLKGRFVLSEI